MHIGAFSEKIMAKIVALWDNKTYITPSLGPQFGANILKVRAIVSGGIYLSRSPRVPGTGVIKFPGLFDLGAGHVQ